MPAVRVSILCILPSLFLGEYVASGSDDGRWFIWEKQTGRLIKMLSGDEAGNLVLLTEMFRIVALFISEISILSLLQL